VILDTSAVLAILFDEPDAAIFAKTISQAVSRSISAATFTEISILVETHTGAAGSRDWDMFFRRARIAVEPLTEEHSRLAAIAWSKFGKGRHPARLNFGDCFSYALAKSAHEPLLFKGSDFSQTDIVPAL
jgi:ribonuclease VapC